MPLTGNESEIITLQEAIDMTSTYDAKSASSAVKAHLFGKTKLMELLNQEDCVAMRAYYGIDEMGQQQLVLVGVTAEGKDLYNGIILDRSITCPVMCDTGSPLY